MPRWSNTLPARSDHHGYDLRRTPRDGTLKALVTSDTIFVCHTHFWGGRTVPCEQPECPACNQGSPTRAHCYLSCLVAGSHEHILFECTAQAAVPFQDWLDTYGTLRGCLFTALRPKRCRNGKVEVTCRPFDLTKIALPKSPDIPAAMAVIWQLPTAAIEAPAAPGSIPGIKTRAEILRAARENDMDFPAATLSSNGNGTHK